MLFDWLVIGQVMPTNPAHSVRGPRHSVTKGVTPVLSSEEATALLTGTGVSTAVGLRDRAIIAVMETMLRVGLREVQHGALLAALRRVDFHFALLFFGKQFLHHGAGFEIERDCASALHR